MAMLIAALCAEGTSEIGNIRQIDRGYERIDERLRDARRAHRARRDRARRPRVAEDACRVRLAGTARAPMRQMTREPPDPQRHARRPARRDARAARDRGRAARHFDARRLRRGLDARARVRGDARARRRRPRCRPTALFDDHGEPLALRADMTVPIARLVATRYAAAEPPLRFCYFAHAYRGVRPHRGQMREFLQAGIELVGAPGAGGHGRGADGAVRARSTRPACAASGSASATRRSIRALLERATACAARRASGCCTSSPRATSSGSSARSCARPRRARRGR